MSPSKMWHKLPSSFVNLVFQNLLHRLLQDLSQLALAEYAFQGNERPEKEFINDLIRAHEKHFTINFYISIMSSGKEVLIFQ